MNREFDMVLVYDDKYINNNHEFIKVLNQLFEKIDYVDSFHISYKNIVIVKTLDKRFIRIGTTTRYEFIESEERYLYEYGYRVFCLNNFRVSNGDIMLLDSIFKRLREENEFKSDYVNHSLGYRSNLFINDERPLKDIKKALNIKYGCCITKVIFNARATIVFWSDYTKTVVKLDKDDIQDKEKGLAMAISKKFLGNNGNYYNEFRKWLKNDYQEIKGE